MVEETIQTIREAEREAGEIGEKKRMPDLRGILENAPPRLQDDKGEMRSWTQRQKAEAESVARRRKLRKIDAGSIEGSGSRNCVFTGDSACEGGGGCKFRVIA